MIQGRAHPDFEALADLLAGQVRGMPGGAAVAVYHEGEPVVDVWAGERGPGALAWEQDTMALSFSTTKGVTSTALHLCADRGLLDYDRPVARYWPEFAQAGKDAITVRQVLCHEAGLHRIRSLVDHSERLLDWDHMVDALAASPPAYPPGTANGYHAITYGWLVGEIVRRVSGVPVDEFVQKELAAPLGLDGLHIGAPPEERHRVARLLRPMLNFDSVKVVARTVSRAGRRVGARIDVETSIDALYPRGFFDVFWSDRVHDAPVPAANGTFTARSLARLYAMWANGGELDGVRLLSERTVRAASTVQNRRRDVVLGIPMRWRLGFHMVGTSRGFLPHAFGHFGYGGSGAWACPRRRLSVAFVTNRVAGTPIADARMIRLGGAAGRAAETRHRPPRG